MKKILSITLVFLFLLNSCKKEVLHNSSTNSENTSTIQHSLKRQGLNILEFESEQALQDTLLFLRGKDDAFLDTWEVQKGFTSMRKIFNEVAEAEIQVANKYENLPPQALAALQNKPVEHSQKAILHKNMLVTRNTDDGAQYYEKNIHTDELSRVVNEDGIVIVGDKIYQHISDKIKIITDGDVNKIPLLKAAVVTNANQNIQVFSVSGTNTFNRSCQSNDGRLRIIVYEDFIQNTSTFYPTNKVTTYRVRVRSLQRRLFGAWYDNYNTNISLNGNHVGNITSGWFANNNSTTINWSGAYNVASSGQVHTFEIYLPYPQMLQSNPGLRTDGLHPEIYQSWHKGTASRSGRTATCTTYYP